MPGFGTCVTHGAARSEKYRQNADLYNLPAWKSIKRTVRSREPLCAACLTRGIVKQMEIVDHVFPHRRDERRFIRNVFQSLCTPCHTQKTKYEARGRYLHYRQAGVIEYRDEDYAGVVAEIFGN